MKPHVCNWNCLLCISIIVSRTIKFFTYLFKNCIEHLHTTINENKQIFKQFDHESDDVRNYLKIMCFDFLGHKQVYSLWKFAKFWEERGVRNVLRPVWRYLPAIFSLSWKSIKCWEQCKIHQILTTKGRCLSENK